MAEPVEYTAEQYRNAARAALEAGDNDAARRLIAAGRKVERAEKSLGYILRDNIVGIDDGHMSAGEKLGILLNLGGEGLTLGVVGDEAAAGFDALTGRGSYDERLQVRRDQEAQVKEENPAIALGAEIIPSLALPAGAMASAGGLLARTARGAVAAGVAGGTYGFAEGEGGAEERLQNAKLPAVVSGGLGLIAPVGGKYASDMVDGMRARRAVKQAAKTAPGRDQLESTASRLFDDTQNARMSRANFRETADTIAQRAYDSGMDEALTPGAARVVHNIKQAAADTAPQTISMREMNTLRRQAKVPAANFKNPTESAIATRTVKALDDHIDRVAPQLGERGREARKMWATLRKMDRIDEIFANASRAASGMQNGLIIEFRRILKSPKLRAGFSKAELAAMDAVVRPGILQSTLRQFGRIGLSLDNGSNALGGVLGAAGGAATAGPIGMVVAPLLGTAARKASEMATESAAKHVGDVVRTGGRAQVPALTSQARDVVEEGLLRFGRGAGISLAQ